MADAEAAEQAKAEAAKKAIKSGILKLHLISANITHDTDAFGKLDPYVEIWVEPNEKAKKSTKIYEDAGLKPEFKNEVFEFELTDLKKLVTFRVMDKDATTSDEVGRLTKVAD